MTPLVGLTSHQLLGLAASIGSPTGELGISLSNRIKFPFLIPVVLKEIRFKARIGLGPNVALAWAGPQWNGFGGRWDGTGKKAFWILWSCSEIWQLRRSSRGSRLLG